MAEGLVLLVGLGALLATLRSLPCGGGRLLPFLPRPRPCNWSLTWGRA